MELNVFSELQSNLIKIIKEFKNKSVLHAEFDNQAKENGINSLKLPGKTRWGSIYTSLYSIYSSADILKRMAINNSLSISADVTRIILDLEYFWPKVELFIGILKPIYEALILMQSNNNIISNVVEHFYITS